MQNTKRINRRRSEQNPLIFYLSALVYVLIVSLVYTVSFAPLLALFLFEKESGLRYLALLCPLLVITIVLPLRFSFAQSLSNRYHHGGFTLKAAFSTSLYGEKVAEGFMYALHLIKWLIPLVGACATLYYMYYNTEVFALIKGVTDVGVASTAVWNSAAHFLVNLFGGDYIAVKGGIVEGVFTILGILGACMLFFIWGIVRNSAYRYIWVEATELDKNPRYEARRSLRGRRFRQIGFALINLMLLMPVLIALNLLFEPKAVIEQYTTQYADALIAQTALPSIVIPYGKLAIVYFACYLPLLPLRRMITSQFATARIRSQLRMQEFVPAAGSSAEKTPLLYKDKPGEPVKRKP